MAPTTLVGQKSTTSQYGRSIPMNGNPIRVAEMLATLDGPAYIARVALTDPANVRKAKQAIKRGFEMQLNKKGFSLIEVLSTCPTNWGMAPVQAAEFVKNEMTKEFPLGVFKDITKD